MSALSIHAGDRAQIHGFFSQAAVHTSANEAGGSSQVEGGWDGVGWDMREIGVNASYRPDADWLFAGQALARWAGNTDDGSPRIDFAMADRVLYGDDNTIVGVQIGKVKNPYGLYNTTRDVAHTRPGVIMPQSIYMDRVRDVFLAAPGVSLYGNQAHGAWDTAWRLNILRPEAASEDLENLLFLRTMQGGYKGENSWLGQVMTELDGGQLRLGLTLGRVVAGYEPSPGERVAPFGPLMGAGQTILRPAVLSFEWNEEQWSLTGEYAQVRNRGKGYNLGGAGPEDPNTVEAWYLQGTWRINPSLQAYLRRDVFYFDKDDRSGAQFQAATGVPAHVMYAKDWVLGARYDWKQWAFSAEVHDVKGTAWLSPLETPILNQAKSWRMFLLQAAYRF